MELFPRGSPARLVFTGSADSATLKGDVLFELYNRAVVNVVKGSKRVRYLLTNKTILVTGFKPFNKSKANVSEDVVKTLEKNIGGLGIRTLVIEVKWGEPEKRIKEEVNKIKKEGQKLVAIVGFGQTCQQGVEIEGTAHNIRNGKDEADVVKNNETIDPTQPKNDPSKTTL